MLSREAKIMQSVQDWVNDALASAGYSGLYEMTDTHPQLLKNPLDVSIISLTKSSSTPTIAHEIGGPYVLEELNFAFDVVGRTEKLAHGLSRVIEDKMKNCDTLPMKDYDSVLAPVVQRLLIISSTGIRMRIADPAPWQRFWYRVSFRVQDEYNVTYS